MPPTRTFVLNGVTEYPTEVEEIPRWVGETLEADDGTPTVVVTGFKPRWILRWGSPLPAVADRIRGLHTLRVFDVTDPYGATYSVTVPLEGFRHTIVHLPGSKVGGTAGGTTEPGLELEIWRS